MSLTTIGLIGVSALIVLLYSRMPVGFAMGFVGLLGFSYVVNLNAGVNLLVRDVWDIFSSYNLTVIPLFVFMGQVAFHAGISRRLYDSAYVVFGHWRGGLAMTTVGACALFSAICGSTNATAATMAIVTLPEMKRYGYDMRLATGTVAAAGSLGIMIPPSVIFIVYGIMTEQSIGKLFAAGILPGILLAALFMLTIYIQVSRNPALAPPGPKTSLKQKLKSFIGVVETMILFGMVMGGMFWGLFYTHRSRGNRCLYDSAHRAYRPAAFLAGLCSIPVRYDQNQLHDHGDCHRRRGLRSFHGHHQAAL